jgi:hypothetical protein
MLDDPTPGLWSTEELGRAAGRIATADALPALHAMGLIHRHGSSSGPPGPPFAPYRSSTPSDPWAMSKPFTVPPAVVALLRSALISEIGEAAAEISSVSALACREHHASYGWHRSRCLRSEPEPDLEIALDCDRGALTRPSRTDCHSVDEPFLARRLRYRSRTPE